MRGHAVRCLIAGLLLAGSFASAIPTVAQDSDGPLSGAETDWSAFPHLRIARSNLITVDGVSSSLETDTPKRQAGHYHSGPSEDDLPEGGPADDDTVAGISATLWESTACLNGGDFARFLALMTPSGVQFFLMSILEGLGRAPGPFTVKELAEYEANFTRLVAEEPEPSPIDERSSIDEIRDVRVLNIDQVLAS